jgi:hypothetical protein
VGFAVDKKRGGCPGTKDLRRGKCNRKCDLKARCWRRERLGSTEVEPRELSSLGF